jgi:aspartate/methionine/tyrosine aminotransferase
MDLPPFLLDQWLAAHQFVSPPIAYDLAASTGPRWAVRELLSLGEDRPALEGLSIGYAPSEGSRALREAIGAFYGIDSEWVTVTTGGSEALSILMCLSSRPGGNVVLPHPGFSAFVAMAGAWGLGVKRYVLDRDQQFRQSVDDILRVVDADTVLVLVNTPHNPTGSVMAREDIEALATQLAKRGIPLLVDEVYHPLYFGRPAPSAAGIANVIVMSDMSKALSLSGLRMGWIVDSDAERRERIINARSYFTISSSPVLEALATHALRHSKHILERLSQTASTNLSALSTVMERASDRIGFVKPQGGTVSFPWFHDGRDSRPFCKALAKAGVLVAPGDCFAVPDHMRIGFGAQAEGFDKAATILSHVLDEVA